MAVSSAHRRMAGHRCDCRVELGLGQKERGLEVLEREIVGLGTARSAGSRLGRGIDRSLVTDVAQVLDPGEHQLADPAPHHAAAQLELVGGDLEAGLAGRAGCR
ncbi:MAG: hypothetical protein R3E68_11260 [Burkholderiaceae bacterium]